LTHIHADAGGQGGSTGGLLAPIQEIFSRIGIIPASCRHFGFLACTGVAGLWAQMENNL